MHNAGAESWFFMQYINLRKDNICNRDMPLIEDII